MVLTNIAVAEQVAVNVPQKALLRRHNAPIDTGGKGSFTRWEHAEHIVVTGDK